MINPGKGIRWWLLGFAVVGKNNVQRLSGLIDIPAQGNLRGPVSLKNRFLVEIEVFDHDVVAFDFQLVGHARPGVILVKHRNVHFEPAQVIPDVSLVFGIAHHDDAGFLIDDLGSVLRVDLSGKDVVDRLLKHAGFGQRGRVKANAGEKRHSRDG